MDASWTSTTGKNHVASNNNLTDVIRMRMFEASTAKFISVILEL